jgi:uncharacterized protein
MLELQFARELWLFLPPRLRRPAVEVSYDGMSSLGHVVQSAGVPLTEIGDMTIANVSVPASHRPRAGDVVRIDDVRRPQPIPEQRFLLDVHLGTLARRLRLLGVDTAYHNDRDDDELIVQANAERRVLLTRDRGLLRRRALWLGAYVRGDRPDDQLADILGRFAPEPAPWTRCVACNGLLAPVGKAEIEGLLLPGTRRSYDTFARCASCGRIYWRGAHGDHLAAIVDTALAD